jgi:acetyl-CoA carboxylase biotin carboxyl carrier protein
MTKRKKRESPRRDTTGIDWRAIDQVLEFMAERELEEFEYRNGARHIRLKRVSAGISQPAAPAHAAGNPTHSAPASTSPHVAAAAPPVPTSEDLKTIKSPIVGTYYSAPSPGAPPFVKVGDTVTVGQVLCIIEAMKLMNEIESDVAGEVVEVFVENGQPVEYGESLFAIRASRST